MNRDPVCGMAVKDKKGQEYQYQGQTYSFCSPFCKERFVANPESYLAQIVVHEVPDMQERSIAYFSMEIAIDSRMPTFSGGLGVLAVDTLRSCAVLRVPVVAVTLLYENGYFYQKLDDEGNQTELPVQWNPRDYLRPLPETVDVQIEGRSVVITAWQYDILGISGWPLPVIFLDANLEANGDLDRALTQSLYGGDERYRLAQEIILGIGGIRMLRRLGYSEIKRYHMNEGHAALLALELLR